MPRPRARMLVVHADPDVRRIFAAAANTLACEPLFAADVAAVEQQLAAAPVEYACVGLGEPGWVALLGTWSRVSARPLRIVVAATADTPLVSSAWRAGADEVLHLPLDGPSVCGGLLRAARRRRRRATSPGRVLPPDVEQYTRLTADSKAAEILARRYRGETIGGIATSLQISEVAVKKKLRRTFFKPLGADRLLDLEPRARQWLAHRESLDAE